MAGDYYSDVEVDELCDGLTQHAAMARHLRRLGLRVDRKPNGRPLAWRPDPASEPAQNGPQQVGDVIVGLQAWAASRRQRGAKAQGR